MMQITTHSADETQALGQKLASRLAPGNVIAYFGDLGAGKTAFTRGLAQGLGITDPVTSPTYTIVNEYLSGRIPLFHFDMYRLGSSDELFDIGWEDYLAPRRSLRRGMEREGAGRVFRRRDRRPHRQALGYRAAHHYRQLTGGGLKMLILAFESSAKAASVALCRDGHLVSQYSQCSGLTHSRTLLPMAEDMLKNAELTIGDIDAFAVAHGPGSFTGIRIGVSTVKGLAWASDKPCVGVSTLEAMAWHGVSAGGYICPVMDARRSQVYNAIFKIEGGRPVRMTADRPISLEDLASELRELDSPVFLVGDGAAITAAYLGGNNIAYRAAPENLVWQSAWGVAMAAQDKPFGSADDLLPVYLRLSQAERERQEKLAKT